MLESFGGQLAVLFMEAMSRNIMSREAYAYSIAKAQVATKLHTFHDNYNNHQTLAMSGRCIAAECNTTSDVGYYLQSFPKDET